MKGKKLADHLARNPKIALRLHGQMKLNPQELEKIANLTLEHYDQDAEEFWRDSGDAILIFSRLLVLLCH